MLSVKVIALCFVVLGMVAANGARAANPVVVMETSMGTIKIELFEDKAPVTVKNFLEYVDDKHYDGTIFHRVIDDFMIQGGGFEPGMKEKKTKRPDQERVDQRAVERRRHPRHGPHLREPDSATASSSSTSRTTRSSTGRMPPTRSATASSAG